MSFYTYNKVHLTENPLSYVLCQLRFSQVLAIESRLELIQEAMGNLGFGGYNSSSGSVLGVTINSQGASVDHNRPTITRHDFRNITNDWSIVVTTESLALVTSAYVSFEEFSGMFGALLKAVSECVPALQKTFIQRIGIRYVDAIVPAAGKSWKDYLKPAAHGIESNVFTESGESGKQPRLIQNLAHGPTKFGHMAIRVWQNLQGLLAPPDIIAGGQPMTLRRSVEPNQLITLVDTDHSLEGTYPFDHAKIIGSLDVLHQGCNAVWFNDLVTDDAIRAWGGEVKDA